LKPDLRTETLYTPGGTLTLKAPFASETTAIVTGPLIVIDAPGIGAPEPLRIVPEITADVAAGGAVCADAAAATAMIEASNAATIRPEYEKQRAIITSFGERKYANARSHRLSADDYLTEP
jgi:hypothetical protein